MARKAQTAPTAEAAIPITAAAKAAEAAARKMTASSSGTKAGTSAKSSKAGSKKAKGSQKPKAAGTGPKRQAGNPPAEQSEPQAVHSMASAAIRDSEDFKRVQRWIRESLVVRDPVIDATVEEYLSFWVQRKLLAQDVEERGVLVMDDRGRLTENRNVSLGIQVSKQMQVLLAQLGQHTKKPKAEEDEEEDDL